LLVAGQLVERKMPFLILSALSATPSLRGRLEVRFVGTGPLEGDLKRTTKDLGLDGDVVFLGAQPYEKMQKIYAESDALVHASYREAGSHVVPEALSLGLPVICHEVGGLDYFVDGTCGIVIPLHDEAVSLREFSAAFVSLLEVPDLLPSLSKGALDRARSRGWPDMAKHVAEMYTRIMAGASK
jgi:glycosyltransferase involved in cell wall biosynthesis